MAFNVKWSVRLQIVVNGRHIEQEDTRCDQYDITNKLHKFQLMFGITH